MEERLAPEYRTAKALEEQTVILEQIAKLLAKVVDALDRQRS